MSAPKAKPLPKVEAEIRIRVIQGVGVNIEVPEDPMVAMNLLLFAMKQVMDSGKIGPVEKKLIEVPKLNLMVAGRA